jgi:hypothetical protein
MVDGVVGTWGTITLTLDDLDKDRSLSVGDRFEIDGLRESDFATLSAVGIRGGAHSDFVPGMGPVHGNPRPLLNVSAPQPSGSGWLTRILVADVEFAPGIQTDRFSADVFVDGLMRAQLCLGISCEHGGYALHKNDLTRYPWVNAGDELLLTVPVSNATVELKIRGQYGEPGDYIAVAQFRVP